MSFPRCYILEILKSFTIKNVNMGKLYKGNCMTEYFFKVFLFILTIVFLPERVKNCTYKSLKHCYFDIRIKIIIFDEICYFINNILPQSFKRQKFVTDLVISK